MEKKEEKKGEKQVGKGYLATLIIIIIVLIIVVALLVGYVFNGKENKKHSNIIKKPLPMVSYQIKGNTLDDFDLGILKLENNKKNKIYSPLSIKTTLGMLREGSDGVTRDQISTVLGNYKPIIYPNSKNMSFANALFVKNSFKKSIKDSYIKNVGNVYNAEVLYDSFKKPDYINDWVSKKTFNMINNIVRNVSSNKFILVNSLAINMEWKKQIQPAKYGDDIYVFELPNRSFFDSIGTIEENGYSRIDFDNINEPVQGVYISAACNKYDIVKDLGEETIRKQVTENYIKRHKEENLSINSSNLNDYVDEYIKDISSGYNKIGSSTDFKFFVDDNVKVFAKDLKEYNGQTLQYIGIMPKKIELSNYIENVNASDINNLISKLKEIKLDTFDEGVVTWVHGDMPLFKFDYELNLNKNLNTMGITDVFDSNKANLSNLIETKSNISRLLHKSNIDFSNKGIKASAVTVAFSEGFISSSSSFEYEVPIKEIDITFNKPYLFLIRDKSSGELWFTGTVYEPNELY